MIQFIVRAYDGEGKLPKRLEVCPRHFENMERMKDHVVCAGGMLDEDGKMIGSLLVMEFENREQLDEYLASEPYVVEHVWERLRVGASAGMQFLSYRVSCSIGRSKERASA